MTSQDILEDLLALLEGAGISVRNEAMGGGGGGLCQMKGKQVFFVDKDSSTSDNAAHCAKAVAETVDIESIYLKPEVRDFVERHISMP
jgi:hypothetical protein